MGDVKVRAGTSVCTTALGTQALKITGFGKVKAAQIQVCSATADNTETNDLIFSTGFWADGGTDDQGVVTGSIEHSNTASTSYRDYTDFSVIKIIDPSTGGVAGEARVLSSADDGITLEWTTAAAAAYKIQYVFFGGEDLEADLIDYDVPTGSTVSYQTRNENGVAFEPDLCLFAGCGVDTADAITSNYEFSYGAAHNGTSITQVGITWNDRDTPATNTEVTGWTTGDCVNRRFQPVTTSTAAARLELDAFNVDGVDLQNVSESTTPAMRGMMLAIRTPEVECHVEQWQTKTDASFSTGWQAQIAHGVATAHFNTGAILTGPGRTGGGSFCVEDIDGYDNAMRFKFRDNVATTDCHTEFYTTGSIRNEAGDNSRDLTGDFRLNATNVQVSLSAKPGEDGESLVWIIEEGGAAQSDKFLPLESLTAAPALGTPTLVEPDAPLPLPGLSATPALGTPTVAAGTVTKTLPSITAAPAQGTPALFRNEQLPLPGLTASAALGTPTLAGTDAALPLPSLTASPALGTPDVAPGPASLPLPSLTATAAQGTPDLFEDQPLPLPSLAASPALGTPTVAPGPAALPLPSLLANAALGTPALAPTTALPLPSLTRSPALGTPILSPDQDIPLPSLTATPALGTPDLIGGPYPLPLPSLTRTPAFGVILLEAGAVTKTLPSITATPVLGTPTIIENTPLLLPSLAAAPALGTPELELSLQVLPLASLTRSPTLSEFTLSQPVTSGDVNFAVVNFTAPGSTGTQDIAGPSGMGTPALMMLVATYATSDDSLASDAGLSLGLLDELGNQRAVYVTAADALSGTNTGHGEMAAGLLQLITPGSSSTAFGSRAVFDSFITDGVRINWEDIDYPGIRCTAYFWYGADVEGYVDFDTPSSLLSGTTTFDKAGWPAQQIIMAQTRTAIGGSPTTEAQVVLGFADIQPGGSITQGCISMHWDDAQLAGTVAGLVSDQYVIQKIDHAGTTGAIEVTSDDPNGFVVTNREAGTQRSTMYAQLRYTGGAVHWMDVVDIATSGTSQTVNPPDFLPVGVVAAANRIPTADSFDTTEDSGVVMVGGSDGTTEHAHVILCEDGSDDPVCQSLSATDYVSLPEDTGAAAFAASVSFASLDLTWSTPDASGLKVLMMAFGNPMPGEPLPLPSITATPALGTPEFELGPPPQALPLPGLAATPALGTPEIVAALNLPSLTATPAFGLPFLQIDPQTAPEKMASALTARLEAVNVMLATIGQPPTSSLSANAPLSVVLADATLNEVLREVQSQHWNFNTEYEREYTPDTSSRIYVGTDVIWAVDESRATNVTLRGRQLYDLEDGTYEFDSPIKLTIRVCLDWDQLPEPARRYIEIRAARIFQQRIVGSVKLDGFTSRDEERALAALRAFDTDEAQYDLRSNPDVYRGRRRDLGR